MCIVPLKIPHEKNISWFSLVAVVMILRRLQIREFGSTLPSSRYKDVCWTGSVSSNLLQVCLEVHCMCAMMTKITLLSFPNKTKPYHLSYLSLKLLLICPTSGPVMLIRLTLDLV